MALTTQRISGWEQLKLSRKESRYHFIIICSTNTNSTNNTNLTNYRNRKENNTIEQAE